MSEAETTTISNSRNERRTVVDEQVQTDGVRIHSLRHQIDTDANRLDQIDLINRVQIDDEAHVLACDYVTYRLRKAGFEWTDRPSLPAEPSRCCLVMRTLGDEFERRYSEVFRDMSTTLQITPSTAYQTFLGVCNELFRGDANQLEIKWGRVVALYTFAGALAVQCVDKEMPQQVRNIVDWVSIYAHTYLSPWIATHGGWNGFVQFYEKGGDEKWSSFKKVMTGFGVACGAVGVATLAGFALAGRP